MLLFPSRLCFPVQLPVPSHVTQEGCCAPASQHSRDVAWPHGHAVGTLRSNLGSL